MATNITWQWVQGRKRLAFYGKLQWIQQLNAFSWCHCSASNVTDEERVRLAGQRGCTIWLTGLSGRLGDRLYGRYSRWSWHWYCLYCLIRISSSFRKVYYRRCFGVCFTSARQEVLQIGWWVDICYALWITWLTSLNRRQHPIRYGAYLQWRKDTGLTFTAGLNKDLGFSQKDREENIRRIGEVR